MERRKALAALVLFVGRRYYLRPIIRPWNARRANGTPEGLLEQPQASGTREAHLERPQAFWNAPWRYWNARRAHSGYTSPRVR